MRLAIDDPGFAATLFTVAPGLRRAGRRGLLSAVGAAIAFAAIAALLWRIYPVVAEAAVRWIPHAWEERLGTEILATLPGRRCENRAGLAALQSLVDRLTRNVVLPHKLSVTVVDSDIENAFALPGGRIVVMRGLLQAARSPDELAGVLAHEISHELRRHPTRQLITRAGSSVFFDLLLGNGRGASLGATLTTLSYSRAAEAEADDGAIDLLRRAGIGANGLANLLERLNAHPSALPPYLSTHPATGQRLAMIRKAAPPSASPALSDADWLALVRICNDLSQ